MAVRFISNPAPQWSTYKAHIQSSDSSGKVKYAETVDCRKILEKARGWLKENIAEIQKVYPPDTVIVPSSNAKKKEKNAHLYIGAGGNAYLHWKLSRFYEIEGDADRSSIHMMRALEAVNTSLMLLDKKSQESGIAFYIGATGVHALAAVIYNQYKEPPKTQYHLEKLISFLSRCLAIDTPDELLFGRAGFLSCFLFVKKHLPSELCEKLQISSVMRQVFDCIISSGQEQASHDPTAKRMCLKYFFYGSDYLGAAHGISGILYILLQFPDWCKEPEVIPWILGSLDHLVSIQMHSGNFPSKDSGRKDGILVHWCHGAPGLVALLHRAYTVFGDKKYLKSMEMALECVWKFGIIRKGFGACHGITGNAYAFLCRYRYTGEDEYYYKALQMAECVWNEEVKKAVQTYPDPQRYKIGEPDCPYSLMEGLAGTICFFCDLLHPEQAGFPGYDGECDECFHTSQVL